MMVRWQRVLIYSLAGLCSGLLLFSWNERSIQRFHLDIMSNDLAHQARLMEPLYHLNELTTDGQLDAIREQLLYHLTIVDRRGKVVAFLKFIFFPSKSFINGIYFLWLINF